MICLIHQANYLLDQHGASLERAVIEKGGYREQLTAARLAYRDQAEPKGPACPDCGAEMRKRNARSGKFAGKAFWGCSRYPECRGIREVEQG